MPNKKLLVIMITFFLFFALVPNVYALDGFFLGTKGGFLLKIDIASAFASKRVIDSTKSEVNAIPTGIGYIGMTDPHGFPRVFEALVAPYGELQFNWGYKFPKIFSLGFGVLLSNIIMPSLMFDFKFSFRDGKKVRPYTALSIYSGLLDGFPIGITAVGGIDIFINKHFYFLIEAKLGAEIFVHLYYDDGNNANAIWHFDSTYAYGVFGIYVGLGYQFKNRWTDSEGKWVGRPKK